MIEKTRMLQGKVLDIERTGQFTLDDEGNKWEKCVFTIELTNFSKRTPEQVLPDSLKGKRVKISRYCCFDWHYKIGVRKTLEPDEMEAILEARLIRTAELIR